MKGNLHVRFLGGRGLATARAYPVTAGENSLVAHVLTTGLALGAAVLFAIGLVSPLTPSEGCPSFPHLATFAVLPFGLASVGCIYSRPLAAKTVFAAEALAIAGATSFLLHRIDCLR
jgi:hypothetical protein